MNVLKIPINDMLGNKTRTVALVAIVAIISCLLAVLLALREGANGQLSFVTASRINVKSRLPQNPLLPLRYLETLKTIPDIDAISYIVGAQGGAGIMMRRCKCYSFLHTKYLMYIQILT